MRTARMVMGICGLSAVLASSCFAPERSTVDFSDSVRQYRGADYSALRKLWTRHAQEVRYFGTVIEAWSTLKSWDFRQAYVERYAEIYSLAEPEKADLRSSQLEAWRNGYEFHLTVQCTDYKWNNLEDADTVWRVSLIDATGAELRPESVEVRNFPVPYEMEFFPMRTDFSRTYAVVFPKQGQDTLGRPFQGEGTGKLTLRIAGPLGRAELTWESARLR